MTYRTFGQLNQSGSNRSSQNSSSRNNFNFLRFFLALVVIFGHSFLLLPDSGVPDPVTHMTRGQMTSGSWAVQGFFIISGFLIAQSWKRKPSLTHFLKNRALRIYPGWIASLLVCVLVVAPVSGVPLGLLLRSRDTWLFFSQLLLHASPALPGAFANNPVPNTVNGSLWTIPLEILCYLSAALCGLCGLKLARIGTRWYVFLLFLIGLLMVKFAPSTLLLHVPWLGTLQALPFYGTCFLAGMMLFEFRDRVPVSWPLFFTCLGIMIIAALRKQGMALPFILCGSYALLFVAFLPLRVSGFDVSHFGRRTDLSYGVYLYAYPVQQLIVEFTGHHLMPMRLLLATLPPTLLLAAASWFLVERPFLRLKKSSKNIAASPQAKEAALAEAAVASPHA